MIIVVGGGVFGVTAAIRFAERGETVVVVDRLGFPAVDSASADISKALRADYGGSVFYAQMGLRALEEWKILDARWQREYGRTPLHWSGMLVLASEPLDSDSFEGRSFRTLQALGVSVEPLDQRQIADRYPVWARSPYKHGYFNPLSGWVESTRVVELLSRDARATKRVQFVNATVTQLLIVARRCMRSLMLQRIEGVGAARRCVGIVAADGRQWRADRVLVACGAWTPSLVPETRSILRPVPQPIVLFRAPADSPVCDSARFPMWCADVARTGWYGFPYHPTHGVLKVGNHGKGLATATAPHAPQAGARIAATERGRFEAFVHNELRLDRACCVDSERVCWYCDTVDGNFLIARVPGIAGLTVASGGAGHAFKFAPLLGHMAVEAALHGSLSNQAAESAFGWRWPVNGAPVASARL